MPSKKKKYNARFPAGRIKKIMQTDEEVGKVAQAVPIIISKALEMFIESLLKKSTQITQSRNAKTLTPSHMKQCILSENRFDFLKDLVKNIPDASVQEDNENNALAESNLNFGVISDDPDTPIELLPPPLTNNKRKLDQGSTSRTTPVIQFSPKVNSEGPKINFSVNNLIGTDKLHVTIASKDLNIGQPTEAGRREDSGVNVPPLVPLNSLYGHSSGSSNTGDNLCIDEDYDN
ncbi:hypothetical protein ABEB36_001020 [Hypothenemus hampei]|uniref:Transcription factor CBF/NF-Y/archaeal histone domain-containing protein n=1 Tax=Hypothenemus hampei TaxID=57062 RepID=A0ABD1FD83_HYPHA